MEIFQANKRPVAMGSLILNLIPSHRCAMHHGECDVNPVMKNASKHHGLGSPTLQLLVLPHAGQGRI